MQYSSRISTVVSIFLVILLLGAMLALASPSVWTPKATTSENNTSPTGLSLPDWSTLNLTEQNIAPTGTVTIDNNENDGSEEHSTPPDNSVPITPLENVGFAVYTKPDNSVTIENRENARALSENISYIMVDNNGDETLDNLWYKFVDTTGDNWFDTLQLSMSENSTFDESNVYDNLVYYSNDENIDTMNQWVENIQIGENYRFEVYADNSENKVWIRDNTWWTGIIWIDTDGDGNVDDNVNLCLSDNDSSGYFNVLEISVHDDTFGENWTDDSAYTDNDTILTTSDNIRIGENAVQSYWYEVLLEKDPADNPNPFSITSTSWYIGTLSIDVNDNGNPNTVNFCLSDNDSDGRFDTLDISENATYSQNLTDNKVSSDNDARIWNSVDPFVFGNYHDFVVMDPVNNPAGQTPDFRVRSKSWYYGYGPIIDVDGDGARDNLYVCRLDNNSDGVFNIFEISAFNDNFGQGMLNDNLIADNLAENNDERLTALHDNLHIGPQRIRYEGAVPPWLPPSVSVSFRTKSWYAGTITLHANTTFNFVIWDPDSDGIFENLVFDDDSDDNYSGDQQYDSYPASPVRLPRGSRFAYKVVWFDNKAPYMADPTYGTYDLVMQPLDTTSPAFSGNSPAQGAITSDATPTISVNLADQGTGDYLFDIESISIQVRGQTVSYTYSGGVVSYTPTTDLSDGVVEVSITASDHAKNSASTSWSFIIDTTKPIISISSALQALGATPTATGWMLTTSASSIEVSGSVSDATGVIVKINNKVVPLVGGSFSKTVNLVVGTNTFTITVVDAVGNTTIRTLSVSQVGAKAPPVAPAISPELVIFICALAVIIIVLIVLVTMTLAKKR